MKYRKKPVVIEAFQTDKELDIETLEGTMHASVGDYIITGVRGEQYPCKPDIFEQTYEPADASASPWHRVEDNPPTPGCYLTSSPFFHGDDYSWLYRLAWWTEHGLMDFVQDAEKESGWYIWNNSQDRDTEIEPMYWMPIEPPKEDA